MEYNVEEKLAELDGEKLYWKSFIEQDNLEVGVLKLKPGVKDTQLPHKKDEIYHILSGNGKININGDDFEVSSGKVFYVPRETPHYFHSVSETITCTYFLN